MTALPRPAHDWRVTIMKRAHRRSWRCCSALWVDGHRGAGSSTCRCSSAPIWSRAPSVSRCARRRRPPSAATSSIGAAACWRPASTPTRSYAVPTEIADAADARRRALRRARATATRRIGRRSPSALRPEARVRLRARGRSSPDQAERVAALNLDGVGFIKESKRFYPNKELAAHLLGWVGIDNTGPERPRVTYDRRSAARPARSSVQTDARRHAFSRFERPPTIGLERRADDRRDTSSTSPSASCTPGVRREPRRRRQRRSS